MKRRIIIVADLGEGWDDLEEPDLDDVATWAEGILDEEGLPAFRLVRTYRAVGDLVEEMAVGRERVEPGDIRPVQVVGRPFPGCHGTKPEKE